MPYPPPAIFQLLNCSLEAWKSRGYQARGTLMVRPSRNETHSESEVKLTLETRSSAFNAKMPIPCLDESGLIGLNYGLYSTKLDSTKPKVHGQSNRFQPETLPINHLYPHEYDGVHLARGCRNKSDTGPSSGLLARADFTELRFVSYRHTLWP